MSFEVARIFLESNPDMNTGEHTTNYYEEWNLKRTIRKINETILLKNSSNISEQIEDIIELYSARSPIKNTIFHDAIQNTNKKYLSTLLKLLEQYPKLQVLIKTAINLNGDNLLHYACKFNKYNYIKQLIHLQCKIYVRNFTKSTPLHIALEMGHNKYLQKFMEIIRNSPYLADDVRNLLKAYNRQSYTIMHLAVLSGYKYFVEYMLKFSIDHNIDLFTNNVLTNGDTILHLAVKNNLYEMESLILKYISNALEYENYAGLTIEDIKNEQ